MSAGLAAQALDCGLFLLGCLLLAALVRWWRSDLLGWRAAAGHAALAAAFVAVPLATPALQVGSDIPYQWRPWRGELPERIEPANALLSDVPLQMIPFRTLVRQRLLALEAPLWAHEPGTGQPLLGNAQSAPFAPLHLLALPLPPMRAMTVAVGWQVLVALLLGHALLARLGAAGPAAAFGAIAWALSSWAVAWAYYPMGMTAAFIPGVLLGLVTLRSGERGALAGLVACGTAMALSGHPETLAHTGLLCAAVALVLLLDGGSPGRPRFLGRLAMAAALSACLAAPALLPVLEALPASERMAMLAARPRAVDPPPFAPRTALPVVAPFAFGSPRDGNWRGPSNFNETATAWAGLLPLALALAGAAACRGRLLAMVAGGALALLAALGAPSFLALAKAVPGFEHAAHARLRLFWVLALAVAGGLALDRLLRRPTPALRRAAAAAVAAAAAGVAVLVPGAPWQRAWWAVALAGAGAVLALLLRPAATPWLGRAAVAALAADLLMLGARYNPTVSGRFDLAAPPAVARLVAETQGREGPFRTIAEGYDLMPNLGALYGLWDPRAYDPMRPADAALVAGRRLRPRFRPGREALLPASGFQDQAGLDWLGVRALLTPRRRQLPPPWERIHEGPGLALWRNPRALPLFFVPGRLERAPGPGAALLAALADRDLGDSAVVVGGGPPTFQLGMVEAIRPRANGFDLVVASGTGATVASTVSWAQGWRVEVEGRREAAVVVDGGFLGFMVPPGRHRVRLDYRPAGWRWGLALFGIGVAGALLTAAVGRWRVA